MSQMRLEGTSGRQAVGVLVVVQTHSRDSSSLWQHRSSFAAALSHRCTVLPFARTSLWKRRTAEVILRPLSRFSQYKEAFSLPPWVSLLCTKAAPWQWHWGWKWPLSRAQGCPGVQRLTTSSLAHQGCAPSAPHTRTTARLCLGIARGVEQKCFVARMVLLQQH